MTKQNSFSDFYSNVCNCLKTQGCVEKISTEFSKLSTDSERFLYVRNLASENKFRPSCLDDVVLVKCSPESIRLRNEGNEAFIKGKETKALKLYNRSVLLAPSHVELSLAYANRSAVLNYLGCFKESVLDIDRALQLNYPENLKYKLMKRRGECFCKLGRHDEAKKSYEDSISQLKVASLSEKKIKEVEVNLLSLLNGCAKSHEKIEPTVMNLIECPQSLTSFKNDEVLSASDSIKIHYSEDFGRHVVATKNISPGDIIIMEESFASVLLPEYYITHCYHCLKRSSSLIPCENCCNVMFCSEECRRNSWMGYHEKECSILYYILKLDLGKMAHLSLRIVLSLEFSSLNKLLDAIDLNPYSKTLREKGFTENGKYDSSDYTAIYHLEGHSDKRYVSDLFKRTCMSFCIVSCLKNSTSIFVPDSTCDSQILEVLVGQLILRHLQNLPCNAHEVSELFIEKVKPASDMSEKYQRGLSSFLVEVGAAAYAMLSLINHSCDPNVVKHSYNGSTAILRAIRPINKGEQVLDNYGYHYAVHSIQIRHENLKSQYFFECNCVACLERWPCYQLLKEVDVDENLRCQSCRNGPLKKLENKAEKQNEKQDSPTDEVKLFFCPKCEKSMDFTALKKELASSSDEFKRLLSCVQSGERVDKVKLVNHLLLLDKALIRPWKEYNDCQEAIKICYALEGNCFQL